MWPTSVTFTGALQTGSMSGISREVVSTSASAASSAFVVFFSQEVSTPVAGTTTRVEGVVIPRGSSRPISLSLAKFAVPDPADGGIPAGGMVTLSREVALTCFLGAGTVTGGVAREPVLEGVVYGVLRSGCF